jgi:hypothetical protein
VSKTVCDKYLFVQNKNEKKPKELSRNQCTSISVKDSKMIHHVNVHQNAEK